MCVNRHAVLEYKEVVVCALPGGGLFNQCEVSWWQEPGLCSENLDPQALWLLYLQQTQNTSRLRDSEFKMRIRLQIPACHRSSVRSRTVYNPPVYFV